MKTISQDQPDEVWRELQPLLDQELQRLPEKYRTPIVLCDLESKTRKEAARLLGWPEGTLSGRLSRGRAMLAKRLARHGLAVSGGVLATALCQNAASACVPGPLVVTTVQAATLMAAGKALAAGVISAKVVALTEGVLKTMLLTKIKVAIAVVLALNLIGAGVGLVYCQTAGSGQAGKGQPVTAQKQQPTPKADGKDDEKVAHTDDPAVKQGNKANDLPKEIQAGTDLLGDPLPPGALTRLGTIRLRLGSGVSLIASAPDSNSFAYGGSGAVDTGFGAWDNHIHLADVRTGKQTHDVRPQGDRDARVPGTLTGRQDARRRHPDWSWFPTGGERGRGPVGHRNGQGTAPDRAR